MENDPNKWHLAKDPHEKLVTEFESFLIRGFYGCLTWIEDCQNCISDEDLSGHEVIVLHAIRMQDRPKTIYEIGRIINRGDTANILYAVRKLVKLGLAEKSERKLKKASMFQVTELGAQNTEAYTNARKGILLNLFKQTTDSDLKIEETTKTLSIIQALYDEACRLSCIYNEVEPQKE